MTITNAVIEWSLPKSADSIRGHYLNLSGGPAGGAFDSSGYPCVFHSETPSKWRWDNADIPTDFTGVASLEFRDGAGEVLLRVNRSGSTWTPWTADAEAAYAITDGAWMVYCLGTLTGSRQGLRTFPSAGVGSWYHVGDWHDEANAGWGWHGQGTDAAGRGWPQRSRATTDTTTAQNVRVFFCRTYGGRYALTDKVKCEEVKPLFADRLPPGLSFDGGPLNLTYWAGGFGLESASGNMRSLPASLVCADGLILDSARVAYLPADLVVGESIDLDRTWIVRVGSYAWSADVSWSIRAGTFSTFNAGWLREFESTAVKSLDASGSTLRSLPDGFTADNLTIDRSALRSLPTGLSVSGKLSARRCWLETIPDDLEAGTLDLRDTVVDAWPDDLPDVGRIIWTGPRRELPPALQAKLQR